MADQARKTTTTMTLAKSATAPFTETEEVEKCDQCDHFGKRSKRLFCRCDFGRALQRRFIVRLESTFDRAGMPPRFQRFSLKGARDLFAGDMGKAEAMAKVVEYLSSGKIAGEWGVDRYGIFVHGENGIGKTGLMAGLYNNLVARGATPLWIKYGDLVRDVQSAYGTDAADARLLTAQRVGFLFIDDLGDPFAKPDQFDETNDRRRILFDVVSYRHERHLPLFMTANFADLDQLADQFDTRIADRVMELCAVVEMTGKNLRMR